MTLYVTRDVSYFALFDSLQSVRLPLQIQEKSAERGDGSVISGSRMDYCRRYSRLRVVPKIFPHAWPRSYLSAVPPDLRTRKLIRAID